MARTPVTGMLPGEDALRLFAHAAARLLVERRVQNAGSRTARRRAGRGSELLDHRDYVPGDEIRHIDWRITARQQQPVVRRFESETVSDWMILVDASSSMATNGAAKWRAALAATAAMSYALLELGHRVGVLAFGAEVLATAPAGRGVHHYATIARALTGLQPQVAGESSRPGVCARHLRGRASILLISDFLADDEMRQDLTALLQYGAETQAIQVRDDRDTHPEGSGNVELVDAETGARQWLPTSEPAWRSAAGARNAMTTRLRRFCARNRIPFTDWNVARPWQPALLQHLVEAQASC